MEYSGDGTADILFSDHSTVFYLCQTLVLFIAILAITVPAALVIVTIVRKKELHKYHYWFVANLMLCDILTAFITTPPFIVSSLLKLLEVARLNMSCNVMFSIIYIPSICGGFMVLNSTIDAALAISYPLDYENIMSKAKAVTMVVIAWVLAGCLTLSMMANPELDITVDDLFLCPYNISIFLVLPIVRLLTAFAIIGFNVYLYWVTFKTKWKLKSLVMDSSCPGHRVHSLHDVLQKYKLFARLGVTLLLIIIFDGFLRIFRILLSIFAAYYPFNNDLYGVLFTILIYAEYINHPVVYGLMLRQVHQTLCCKD